MYGEKYSETPEEKEKFRLMMALQQVNNITLLLKDNEWKNYLYNYLSPIQYELERQLTNLSKSDRITQEDQKE